MLKSQAIYLQNAIASGNRDLYAWSFRGIRILTELYREVVTPNVIDSRLVNAFFDKAMLSEINPLPKPLLRQIDDRRRKQAGLWVGGKSLLTTTTLSFSPNEMNRALHVRPSELEIEILLSSINDISVQRRLITNVITVRFETGVLKIRCFKAISFVAAIEEARLAMR
ncbi:hypothetical protein [Brucella cytisi]|uniref:Uncharacterized protein n=1 Tax=Brucella cytisi TaxID=407152 RepID=A0A1J6HJM2_9HYPH|nr:hypothetical protein [Brucella cytisi]NKC52203.1 hypothetical protein [Brucella cytisi]OIS92681.1 hypothetical protein BLA27_14640 [Brucella cytisi]